MGDSIENGKSEAFTATVPGSSIGTPYTKHSAQAWPTVRAQYMLPGYFLIFRLSQEGSIYELAHKAKCILSQYKGTPDFFHPKTTIRLQI